MSQTVPTIKLNNGLEIPVIGIGIFYSDNDECIKVEAIKHAINAGYRNFFIENDEQQVTQAIREKTSEGDVKRKDIFIVTKLLAHSYESKQIEDACRKSLKNNNLEYIDLCLIYLPISMEEYPCELSNDEKQFIIDNIGDIWRAIENLVDLGLTHSIGVSNFNSEQVDHILSIIQGIHLFDFEFTEDEMKLMDSFNSNGNRENMSPRATTHLQ